MNILNKIKKANQSMQNRYEAKESGEAVKQFGNRVASRINKTANYFGATEAGKNLSGSTINLSTKLSNKVANASYTTREFIDNNRDDAYAASVGAGLTVAGITAGLGALSVARRVKQNKYFKKRK